MKRELLGYAKLLSMALVLALIITRFVFQIVSVDGKSMYPTLENKDKLFMQKITYYFSKPKFGDIVVIKYPSDISQKYIKRVIAVGGDKVKIENNYLYINGIKIEEKYLCEKTMENFNEVVVPENTIFVLGDNRNYSSDSRKSDVGFVNLNLVVGKVDFRLYPINKLGKLSN